MSNLQTLEDISKSPEGAEALLAMADKVRQGRKDSKEKSDQENDSSDSGVSTRQPPAKRYKKKSSMKGKLKKEILKLIASIVCSDSDEDEEEDDDNSLFPSTSSSTLNSLGKKPKGAKVPKPHPLDEITGKTNANSSDEDDMELTGKMLFQAINF